MLRRRRDRDGNDLDGVGMEGGCRPDTELVRLFKGTVVMIIIERVPCLHLQPCRE